MRSRARTHWDRDRANRPGSRCRDLSSPCFSRPNGCPRRGSTSCRSAAAPHAPEWGRRLRPTPGRPRRAPGRTGSPRTCMSRLAQPNRAADNTRSRISAAVRPASCSRATWLASAELGVCDRAAAKSKIAWSRGVSFAARPLRKISSVTSVDFSSCAWRSACTAAQ